MVFESSLKCFDRYLKAVRDSGKPFEQIYGAGYVLAKLPGRSRNSSSQLSKRFYHLPNDYDQLIADERAAQVWRTGMKYLQLLLVLEIRFINMSWNCYRPAPKGSFLN